MSEIRVYADFNGVDGVTGEPAMACLLLTGYGTIASLNNQQIRLREGMRLIFFTPSDIEVEGDVFFDRENPGKFSAVGQWKAKYNQDEVRDSIVADEGDPLKHLCFDCRLDIKDYLNTVGQSYAETCPNCGTDVMYPLLPPE